MPTYDCIVREPHREYRHPPILASSLPEAICLLRQRGADVVRVVERQQPRTRRLAEREVTFFFRNLAEALRSAIPLGEALQLVGQQSHDAGVQTAARLILKDVRNGARLSEAAALHGHLFAETHIRLIEAGEESGRLAEALSELADYREETANIGREFLSFLTYPLFVVFVGAFILTFLSTFIVPKFIAIFQDFRVELPAPTVFLMVVQRFVLPVGLLSTFALTLGAFIVWLALRLRPGRLLMDRWVLEMPLLGSTFFSAGLARALGVMAMLVRSQMPLPRMLETTARSVGNSVIEARLLAAAELTRAGLGLTEALNETSAFPTSVTWGVAVAEKGGSLPRTLASLAASYRQESRQTARRRLLSFEPILVILLGLVVVSVIISMFLPLLQIITNLTQ